MSDDTQDNSGQNFVQDPTATTSHDTFAAADARRLGLLAKDKDARVRVRKRANSKFEVLVFKRVKKD